jgi:hypothetical protein
MRALGEVAQAMRPRDGNRPNGASLGLIGWIALALATGIIVFQILVPPAIGLADNGDFAKIIGTSCLRAPVSDGGDFRFRYIYLHYLYSPASCWEGHFHTSESLLFQAASQLNRMFSREGVFDLRWMGVVHASIFVLAFALFVPLLRRLGTGVRVTLLALAVLIFCDVLYSAHYNSFYMDAGSFVFLMLSVVLLAHAAYGPGHHAGLAWLGVLSCLLLVTAKSQHALLAIPLAAFLIWKRRAMWRRRALLCSALAAASICGGAAYSLVEGSPPGYASPCLFNIIFLRLLPTADNPSAELASLGLDDSYLRYNGTYSYAPDSPTGNSSFVQTFLRKTSFVRLAAFYVTHPTRAVDVAELALEEASLQRPYILGNYEKSAGHPPGAHSEAFSAWSNTKAKIAGSFPWIYALVIAMALGIIAWKSPAGGLALGLAGLIEFGLGAMVDACEVTRHLFLFNAVWDLTLFAAACVLAPVLGEKVRPAGIARAGWRMIRENRSAALRAGRAARQQMERVWSGALVLGPAAWITLGTAAAIIVVQILVQPPVGLADNGDFSKIIGPFSLRARDAGTFSYVRLHYAFAPQNHWASGFHSSETLPVQAALLLNRALSGSGGFDLRFMGVVHALLFLLALALFMPLLRRLRAPPRILLLALAVILFCDVVYSAYYNSFYMDAGAFLFLLLAVTFVLRVQYGAGSRSLNAWLAVLSCLLLVTAETQHAWLCFPAAAFLIWKRRWFWPRRALLGGVLAGALIVAAGFSMLAWGSPRGFRSATLFNVIFTRLLPTARNPVAELASLGLDPTYRTYAGMNAYMENSPLQDEFLARPFERNTSYGRLVLFCASHPARALKLAGLALADASRVSPPELGNYDPSAGHPPYTHSQAFSAWSALKQRVLGRYPWLYALIFAMAAGIVAWKFRSGGIALAAVGAVEFWAGVLGDGCGVTGNMFLFNVIWDVTLFAALCVLVPLLDARLRRSPSAAPERP